MCGIIGYIGKRQAQDILLNGLKGLQYRGYDSCGLAIFSENNFSLEKIPGKIKDLEKILSQNPLFGTLGVAHTRWATHGEPNKANAHPHLDCKGEVVLVHNGIIENYQELKRELIREGHKFRSQTDTEVIVHLIEKYYKDNNLEGAVRRALKRLSGSFALGIISKREPDKIIGVRAFSPLIVGLGKNENFLASDIPAILDYTSRVIILEENEIAILKNQDVKITDFQGRIKKKSPVNISWTKQDAQKEGFEHFMLKEIFEQPKVLERILSQRLKNSQIFFEELRISKKELKKTNRICIVACGTAYHAGFVGKYVLERISKIPVEVYLASEFRYAEPILNKDTLLIAISQSGETADTLASVRQVKNKGIKILSICNVLGSSLARESEGVIYTHAGPEISVASTKAYTAQLAILYLFSLYLAEIKGSISEEKLNYYLKILKSIPQKQGRILKNIEYIKEIAKRHSNFGSFLYLGRNINYPSALEGALKLKEISYIPAEGYAAGEMKHGPIALIDEYRAVVCIAVEAGVYSKMLSNIQEIKARKGKIIALASDKDNLIKTLTDEVIFVPKIEELFSPLLVAIPLQLLAYFIAQNRGCEIDQPRNLAKSVTVE